jgi:hypothetical protein
LQPPQLPPQLWPLLLGVDEPPATLCAQAETRFFTLLLLQRGHATFTAEVVRTSFSNEVPQLGQSYSKIGICDSPVNDELMAELLPTLRQLN